MKQSLLSSAESAAQGAKLSAAESAPHYPQPFATEIIKKLEKLGGVDVFDVPSQSDALSAAIGCAISGRRTFLATSFVNGLGDIFRIAQMRLPLVAVDVSRAPGFFKPERNLAGFLEAGWLAFVPESNQELVDTIIRCYRICEDSKVSLPAVVSMDHADFYEPVSLPSEQIIKNFLPKPKGMAKRASYAPKEQNIKPAVEAAAKLHAKINESWKKKFRRTYALSEHYMTEDAERVIVTAGMHTATAKAAASAMRKQGERVGLLRMASLNPFPDISGLAGKNIAVVDSSQLLYNEVAKRVKCSSFVLHSPSEKDFTNVFNSMKK
jgi:pyruvate/2-oxoacid:ferredoxin oxidoreductase alpha subunit